MGPGFSQPGSLSREEYGITLARTGLRLFRH
jgi:hypothetical protein